jgi:DNA-binding IclR family transcriptional regulator
MVKRTTEERIDDALKGLKLMGGGGSLQDVRKAAGLDKSGGNNLANKMIERGYLQHLGHNHYRLTEAGRRRAHELLYGKQTV